MDYSRDKNEFHLKESKLLMGELQLQSRVGGFWKFWGSGSVRMLRKLTLIEGRLLSSCFLTESSITDYMCRSEATFPLLQFNNSPRVVFTDNFSSSLLMEERETTESLRLDCEREEARSVAFVWLRS